MKTLKIVYVQCQIVLQRKLSIQMWSSFAGKRLVSLKETYNVDSYLSMEQQNGKIECRKLVEKTDSSLMYPALSYD